MICETAAGGQSYALAAERPVHNSAENVTAVALYYHSFQFKAEIA